MLPIKNFWGAKTFLILGIAYGLAATLAFLWPVSTTTTWDIPNLDKGVHVVIHAVLALIWLLYVFSADESHFSSKTLVLVLLTCFSYGIAIEAIQYWFIQTRTFDLLDIAANGAGEMVGLGAFRAVRKRL